MVEERDDFPVTPKGVWSGAFFFQCIAYSLMCCMLWPHFGAWFIEKTELGNDFCWFAEGIWETNLHWGDKATHALKCPERYKQRDSVDQYCNFPADSPFPLEDAQQLCSISKFGRALHVLGMLFSFAAMITSIHLQHFSSNLDSKIYKAKLSLTLLAVSLACFAAMIGLIFYSPFYSTQHYDLLGRHNIVPYRGMGCVFQSPFTNGDLFHSKPLKCLYPGPGVAFTVSICLFQCLGVGALAVIAFQKGALIPDQDMLVYSLHGAFMRRLSKFHRMEQYFVGFFVPLIAVGNGALLLSWFYHGMQFAVKVHVDIAGKEFMDTRLQVFCFDPISILRNLWIGGTYLISICTAVFLDFFPLFKIVAWMYFWFMPVDQAMRGRWFVWIEYLGRWSLASLFCLCVIAVGFLFDETKVILFGLVTVRVQVVINKNAGVDWFIGAMIWTVALGSMFLDIHLLAKQWEQQRHIDETTAATASDEIMERRSSLIARFVRRAANQFTRSTGEKRTLSSQSFYPEGTASRPLQFSRWGKLLISFSLVSLMSLTVLSFFLPVIAYHRSGVVPKLLVEERDTQHTLIDLIKRTYYLGGPDTPLWNFAAVVVLFTIIFPVLHVGGLFAMWHGKMAVKRQKQLFRVVEFLGAWSALDVLFLSVILAWLGTGTIGKSVVAATVPGMTAVARELFGPEANVDMLYSEIRPGFWVMMLALVMDKSLQYVLIELSATALALRVRIEDCNEPDNNSSALLLYETQDNEEERDAEDNGELLLYSPADRYVGTSSKLDVIYAGAPKHLWRLCKMCGILEEKT